jgi:hypothetical protein
VIASTDNLGELIKLGEDVFLFWLESFCGKQTNLIMDSLWNKVFALAFVVWEMFKEVIAPVLEVKEAVTHEIAQACNSGCGIWKVPLRMSDLDP